MIAGRSTSQRFLGGIGLYAAIAAYVLFALFPIYWTLKISVTPERLLYSEGITFWPSHMTLQNFVTVLEATDFPRYFLNSVIVSVSTAALVTIIAASSKSFGMPSKNDCIRKVAKAVLKAV